MRALGVVTALLVLLAVPAGVGLVGLARGYLETTSDVAALRVEVAGLRAVDDPARAFAGPDVTLRVYGVARSSLTFAEVNFDLLWQGRRVATVAAFPRQPIPRNGNLAVTVPSNLDPNRAAEARALFAAGTRPIAIEGNARIGLPNSDASVWLTLRGDLRASVGAWGAGRGAWDAAPLRPSSFRTPHPTSRIPQVRHA